MAYYKRLVILSLLAFSGVASAAYQSMRPPPGWQPGGQPAYKPAPGEFYDLDKKMWMTLGRANVGGRELTVPVALPLSTGLSVGLAVASAFSSNPAILLGTIAWGLYQTYLSQKRITPHEDGTFTKVVDGMECLSGCYEYQQPNTNIWHRTLESACKAGLSTALTPNPEFVVTYAGVTLPGTCRYSYTWGGVPQFIGAVPVNARSIPPWTTSTTRVASPTEVATDMQNTPMPKPLVEALPMPLPVGPPVINPNSSGLPQVMRLPQGSPVPLPLPSPNPDNLPQRWRTPIIDLIPAPTINDPWRIEALPKDIVKTDPSPLPDPFNPDPVNPPDPVITPETDPDTQENPPTDKPGLCDLYPDILACAKPVFDVPTADPFQNKNVNLAILPDDGWGPSSAACPAPKTATIMGVSLSMPFTLICDVAAMINPLLIGFAWLSAAFTFIGIGRKD